MIEKLSLNTVGRLDQYIGIIPSIMASNMMIKENTINLKSYVSYLRRLSTMEQIFFEEETFDNRVKICGNKTAEYNLFGQLMLQDLSENELESMLSELKQSKIISKMDPMDDNCYAVKKDPNFDFLETITSSFQSEFNSSKLYLQESKTNTRAFENLIEKLNLTFDLIKELQNENFLVDLNHHLDSLGCSYKNKLNLPLVGSIKGNPENVVVYILSYLESSKKNSELQELNFQMKSMLKYFFQNLSFKKIIKKTAFVGGIVDNCFVRRVVTVSENSKNLCVLYCIMFKSDLFLNTSNDSMIDLRNNIEKKLKWNSLYNMSEYVTISLG